MLEKAGDTPLKIHDLISKFGVKGIEKAAVRAALKQLKSQGLVAHIKGNRWGLPHTGKPIEGRLEVHAKGFGFVVSDHEGTDDIFVPRKQLKGAIHGDQVLVRLNPPRTRRQRRQRAARTSKREGRIVKILNRKHARIVGRLAHEGAFTYLIPDNPKLPHPVEVIDIAPGVRMRDNDKGVVKLPPPVQTTSLLQGTLIEVLGPAGYPYVETISLLKAHGIEEAFSQEVLNEAREIDPLLDQEIAHRRDLRKLVTVTIDPPDAKDFDDAISLRPLSDGSTEVGVHIADVSSFVLLGTAIDREARRRGNSIYLVDRAIPMLPNRLTTEICSLQPHVDKLTWSLLLNVNEKGDVVKHEIVPSVIHSSAQLSYEEVQRFLLGHTPHLLPSHVQPVIRGLATLTTQWRLRRTNAGSIDLELPEVQCILDEDRYVVDIRRKTEQKAYQLVEELMLMANRLIASTLLRSPIPALFRVHEEPGQEQWAEMARQLQAFNISSHPQNRQDIIRLIHRYKETPLAHVVNLAILRNFKQARYASTSHEHFGLAFSTYTHFTSPIRRYSDLVVHRIVRTLLSDAPPLYASQELEEIAAHCSLCERQSDEIASEHLLLNRLTYLEKQMRDENGRVLKGCIVAIKPKGLIVELHETLQRGLIAFRNLRNDYYRVNKEGTRVVGKRTKKVFQAGDTILVKLANVDTARQIVDLVLAQ